MLLVSATRHSARGRVNSSHVSQIFFCPPPKFCLGGRGRKMCIILNHEKNTLPIQDILRVNFYIWGHSFQFGASLCGKNLKFIFQRQILFSRGGNFQFGEILNLCFRGEFCIGVLFSVWANLCMGTLKYLF